MVRSAICLQAWKNMSPCLCVELVRFSLQIVAGEFGFPFDKQQKSSSSTPLPHVGQLAFEVAF